MLVLLDRLGIITIHFLINDFPRNESKSCKLPVRVFTAGPDLRLNTYRQQGDHGSSVSATMGQEQMGVDSVAIAAPHQCDSCL